ncbi:adenylate/guanylate cyclase domain-containing protein [Microvirga massiliensis]|uniref:adenylate/guanylate cyclase domain-containing protein n=1 Tax=Microvirga massiliensis TaxID=1033741 RepID=UPI000A4D10CF|nr:adenylate/guanylate cyclase domain-containing protein [Microvirga massiliensis]
MSAPRIERRLAAVLAADVVGYSRLMEQDERGTFDRLKAHRKETIEPLVAQYHGRTVKLTGDGALCEFHSVVEAVTFALQVQQAIAEREAAVTEEKRIRFRIGINLGDVICEDGDLYGDGVNVAARLESLADPGGVCVSGTAYDHLGGKLNCSFEFLGERTVKNIARPVRVYRAILGDAPAVAASLAIPDRPSIAVLPFDNMCADPEQEFFGDGITEDITTALSKFRGFFVIARNTMFTYKGKRVDVRAVGRELGVRYILEGSVRRAADHVRVTAQLVEAATGQHLWADRYDGRIDDIFAIQDEITASVVGRIGSEVLAAEHARASRKPPQSLDAWECVVRALFLCSQLSNECSRNALRLLEWAIGLDPAYAQALGLKAWITMWRALQGWDDMGQALTLANTSMRRALTADEDEPWAYLAQAMTGYATRDNALAMTALTRAVEINPSFAFAHGQLGIAHAFGGRSEEAIRCIDHALRLSPREAFLGDYYFFYAAAYFQGGHYDLGLRYAREAHRLRPGHVYPLLIGVACAGYLGGCRGGREPAGGPEGDCP